jgi:hypothetical protein
MARGLIIVANETYKERATFHVIGPAMQGKQIIKNTIMHLPCVASGVIFSGVRAGLSEILTWWSPLAIIYKMV